LVGVVGVRTVVACVIDTVVIGIVVAGVQGGIELLVVKEPDAKIVGESGVVRHQLGALCTLLFFAREVVDDVVNIFVRQVLGILDAVVCLELSLETEDAVSGAILPGDGARSLRTIGFFARLG
jgi:hypothetical protein